MIVEYHRPNSLEEALQLLSRTTPRTVPLGGGTVLSQSKEELAVVDLQQLSLNKIHREGQYLKIGAASTLQDLYEHADLPASLREAVYKECSFNLRRMATVAGALVTADGRSPFAAAMLALDAKLNSQPGGQTDSLGDWLPFRNPSTVRGLITEVVIPLPQELYFESVARTPLDRPVLIVAAARWASGRTRVAVGGFGTAPHLALDGPEPGGIKETVSDLLLSASDPWATAEYRQDAAAAIVDRLFVQA